MKKTPKTKNVKRETWAGREKHEELEAAKDGTLGKSRKAQENKDSRN